jgi:hypothetical protein
MVPSENQSSRSSLSSIFLFNGCLLVCRALFSYCLLVSGERDNALPEIDLDNLFAEEIQAKKAVDACTRGKRMGQHREMIAFLAHCLHKTTAVSSGIWPV